MTEYPAGAESCKRHIERELDRIVECWGAMTLLYALEEWLPRAYGRASEETARHVRMMNGFIAIKERRREVEDRMVEIERRGR